MMNGCPFQGTLPIIGYFSGNHWNKGLLPNLSRPQEILAKHGVIYSCGVLDLNASVPIYLVNRVCLNLLLSYMNPPSFPHHESPAFLTELLIYSRNVNSL
jgi:hypothetical protein